MTVENCNQSAQPQKQRSLRPLLGTLALSTTLLCSIGLHQANAGIVESATDATRSSIKKCNGIEVSRDIKRAGQSAFKHWIERCGERAELEMKKTEIGKTYWYGWSTLIPSDWKDTTEDFDIVNQWATYPSANNRNGRFPCRANGSFISRGKNKTAPAGGPAADSFDFALQSAGDNQDMVCKVFPLAKVAEMRGKWTDFVMQVKWTGNKDGFLKFWVKIGDGPYVQKIDYTGRTYWNDEGKGPYFKMGLYKGDPNYKGPAPRVIYTDEYRLGDANSNFGQVAP